MYFCTNIEEIVDAFDGAAPRPIVEVLTELYPECTIDRNNRAHAPYDGYTCEYTNKVFRAGEYLPFEPDEDPLKEAMRGSRAVPPAAFMTPDGEVHYMDGTKKQRAAAADVAKGQAAEFDAGADHVGTVKGRDTFDLVLLVVFDNFGEYGPVFTHYMRDASGNPVVYKGSKLLPMKQGERATIKATVKAHWTGQRDGRKATYINRPVLEGAR